MRIFWKRFYTNGGWFTWVAVGALVVTDIAARSESGEWTSVEGGAFGSGAKGKEAEAAAKQKNAGKNKLPRFKPPPLPGYQSFNFNGVQKDAIEADRAAYARSDRDFATRHKSIVDAERIFEDQTLKDQKGESELLPAIQHELTRAGIEGSLGAFGATGGNLAPGSAGEANVARTLGLGIMDFQDRNRTNRQRSLSIAEDIFPRREFGMNGEDLALSALSDATNQNAFNASNYAAEVGAYEKNYEIDAANMNAATTSNNALAAAKAQADAERTKAYIAAGTAAVGAASSAYGQSSATKATGPNYTYQADGTYRPTKAKYPGANSAWVPVGKYAG